MKKVLNFRGLCFVGRDQNHLVLTRSSNAPTTTHRPFEFKTFFILWSGGK